MSSLQVPPPRLRALLELVPKHPERLSAQRLAITMESTTEIVRAALLELDALGHVKRDGNSRWFRKATASGIAL